MNMTVLQDRKELPAAEAAPAKKKVHTKRKRINYFTCTLPAKSLNEGLARGIISSFCAQLDPTVEELCDMKTAISEAVTNCIVHAYVGETEERTKRILLKAEYFDDGLLCVSVRDYGCGIDNVERAMQPMYSGAASEERSGMGFTVMESFMDGVEVKSEVGRGTTVRLLKQLDVRGMDRAHLA